MSKHTPGPWIATDTPGAGWQVKAHLRSWDDRLLAFYKSPPDPRLSVEFTKDRLKVVATLGYETWCQFPAEGWDEELAADMRLIAAAPQLLEVLKTIGRAHWEGYVDPLIEIRKIALTAIAAAEGHEKWNTSPA